MDICKNQDFCTGCMACADKCKKGAIEFYRSYDGFLYPKINPDKCNNCGVCQKVCPANAHLDKQQVAPLDMTPKVYFVQAEDSERKKSSSGGFCSILAKSFIDAGHYVVGCAFDKGSAVHIIATNEAELDKLRGSKYIQSSLSGCYLKVQSLLKQEQKVLFIGLPCQVAALKSFLGKAYANLVTVDLICHGVCSDDLLQKVIKTELVSKTQLTLEQIDTLNITNIIFRDKSISDFTLTVFCQNYDKFDMERGKTNSNNLKCDLHIPLDESLFYKIFSSNIALRRSCGHCQYAGKWPREGDFTAGDFRGVKGFSKLLDGKGTSIVFANTQPAMELIEQLSKDFNQYREVPFNKAQKSQLNLVYSTVAHPSREQFFRSYYNHLDAFDIKCSDLISKNVAILNFNFEDKNFGAVLTCVGLYQAVRDLGFNPRVIDYRPYFAFAPDNTVNHNQHKFDFFKQNELVFAGVYHYQDSLKELNKSYDSFIVGSDQVLNHCFISNDKYVYYLTFVDPDKNMICYAGSFGRDVDSYLKHLNPQEKFFYGHSLNIFDAVSLREPSSGKKICEALGCNKSLGVLDPVFLCGASYWCSLASKATRVISDNEVVEYTLPLDGPIYRIPIPKGFNSITRFCCDDINSHQSPYQWLNAIANCRLFITDSFHGTCFALIFNRPFIVCAGNEATLVRINELLDLIDPRLKERVFLGDISDIDQTLNQLHIPDWAFINSRIEELKIESLKFLKSSLERQLSSQDIERKTELKSILAKRELPFIKRRLLFYRSKRLVYRVLLVLNKYKYQSKFDKYQRLVSMLKAARTYFKS